MNLVGVSKTAHAGHDTQHVVVRGEDLDVTTGGDTSQGQRKLSVVNAREVTGARRLVLLRLESERVHVDAARNRDARVVSIGLDKPEVASVALGKTVLAVELEQGIGDGVNALHTSRGVVVVSTHIAIVCTVVASSPASLSVDPDELLNRVVKVEVNGLGARSGGRLVAGELKLLNQVLVGDLGEAAALVGVEVDVVNPEASSQGGIVSNIAGRKRLTGVELDVNFNLVVLESNQRQGQTNIAAEPELQRHKQGASRRIGNLQTIGAGTGGNRLLTNHLAVAEALRGRDGELRPDLEPVRVMTINELAADLNLDLLNQVMTDIVGVSGINSWESNLQVHATNEIAVTRDESGHAVVKANRAVKGLLNRLHGEVSVAAVNHLKVSDHGIARKINILGAISNKLHKSSCHFIFLARFFFTV
jgi:hypothetical protein